MNTSITTTLDSRTIATETTPKLRLRMSMGQRAHRKMQRRGAVICHRRMQNQSLSLNSTSTRSLNSTTSLNSSVYSDAPSMRSFSRRFALCSEFDPSVLQALRKFAAECQSSSEFLDDVYVLETTMRTRAQAKPTDVLFSSHKHTRNLDDRSHEGNIQFQSIIHSYYHDMYQFAPSITHRSIVYSAVLDDLKSRGFAFLQGQRLGKDCVHNDESFYVMDDLDALRKIKRAFKRLARR